MCPKYPFRDWHLSVPRVPRSDPVTCGDGVSNRPHIPRGLQETRQKTPVRAAYSLPQHLRSCEREVEPGSGHCPGVDHQHQVGVLAGPTRLLIRKRPGLGVYGGVADDGLQLLQVTRHGPDDAPTEPAARSSSSTRSRARPPVEADHPSGRVQAPAPRPLGHGYRARRACRRSGARR